LLENRDYTLIIDKSGSMSMKDMPDGRSRWETVRDSTLALAQKCEQYDPDGLTLYLFSSRFRRYDRVTSQRVLQIFQENDPVGSSDLAGALEDALNNYFDRKSQGDVKPSGETFLVITDGEPDDRKAVMRAIIEASLAVERDDELAISLLQVGTDPAITEFMKALDDRLLEIGARFDIVDTIPFEQIARMDLTEVLIGAMTG
jgi:hypothetical protein